MGAGAFGAAGGAGVGTRDIDVGVNVEPAGSWGWTNGRGGEELVDAASALAACAS